MSEGDNGGCVSLYYRLNDIRSQKVKYSRLAREKEEEIGNFNLLATNVHVYTCTCVHVSSPCSPSHVCVCVYRGEGD